MNHKERENTVKSRDCIILLALTFFLTIQANDQIGIQPNRPTTGNTRKGVGDILDFLPETLVTFTDSGKKISSAELREVVLPQLRQLIARGVRFDKQTLEKNCKLTVQMLVRNEVILSLAEKAGIKPQKTDAKFAIKKQKRLFRMRSRDPEGDFCQWLAQYSLNPNDLENEIAKKLARDKWLNDILSPAVKVSDKEVRDRFNKLSEKYAWCYHLMLCPGTSHDEKIIKRKMKITRHQMEGIHKKLKNGEKFSNLVTEFSMCKFSSKHGGFLGRVDFNPNKKKAKSMSSISRITSNPNFIKTLFKLEPSEVSDIITTEIGFHLIMRAPYKEISPEIRKMEQFYKLNDTIDKTIEKEILRRKIEIHYK